jgi:hypothetical protein
MYQQQQQQQNARDSPGEQAPRMARSERYGGARTRSYGSRREVRKKEYLREESLEAEREGDAGEKWRGAEEIEAGVVARSSRDGANGGQNGERRARRPQLAWQRKDVS